MVEVHGGPITGSDGKCFAYVDILGPEGVLHVRSGQVWRIRKSTILIEQIVDGQACVYGTDWTRHRKIPLERFEKYTLLAMDFKRWKHAKE